MAYGLRVFNSAGSVTLDVSDRLTRLHSSVSVWTNVTYSNYQKDGVWGTWPSGIYQGFVAIPGMTTDGTWYIVSEFSDFEGYPQLNVSVKQGGFDWSVYSVNSGGDMVQVHIFRV